MRNYLDTFMRSLAYLPEDMDCLLAAYDRIVNHPEATAKWQQALALYDENCNCDYNEILQLADEAAALVDLHVYTAELLIFLCMTSRAKRFFRENGLDEQIYHDTMLDLRYKLEECKAVKGIVGSFVAMWFVGFFQLTRFSFGRLQMEVIPFDTYYEKDGKKLTPGTPVINVHIPRTGTPLDMEACEHAYRKAKVFFQSETGPDTAFICRTWLLYPENHKILKDGSNIRRFMERYDIFRSGLYRDGEHLWRLFDTDERHPDRLPTDTSARRAYVEYLRKGGKTGWGYGAFFL